MSRPRVLLTGASGRLGMAVRQTLGEVWEITGQSLSGYPGTTAADLSTPEGRGIALDAGFDLAVNAAALSSTADCASDPASAWSVNVLWPRELAMFCGSMGIPMIHFSTDLVYSGGVPPYTEDSPAVPRSLYGWTKLLADRAISAIHPGAAILRTSVLFGELGGDRTTFSGDLLSGKVKRVYTDSWRNHTPIHWLASLLPELLEKGASGPIIATARYSTSRSAFAEALLEHAGRDTSHLELCSAPPGSPTKLNMRPELLECTLERQCPDVLESIAMEYRDRTM